MKHNSNPTNILRLIEDACHEAMAARGMQIMAAIRSQATGYTLHITSPLTKNKARFSILNKSPCRVELGRYQFITVYEDEHRPGWFGVTNTNYTLDDSGCISASVIAEMVQQVLQWLAPTPENVRSPRTGFPVKFDTDQPEGNWLAAAFEITGCQIGAGSSDYAITFSGRNKMKAVVQGDKAQLFRSPESAVGCIAVKHASGNVRVLKRDRFNSYYSVIN